MRNNHKTAQMYLNGKVVAQRLLYSNNDLKAYVECRLTTVGYKIAIVYYKNDKLAHIKVRQESWKTESGALNSYAFNM